ncbi:MAG: helix-turn-helix transcriptional regulator [Rhodobacter sp.]|nr:helix-turn-helix transcriptional regulator [Rhodobacter sp.]
MTIDIDWRDIGNKISVAMMQNGWSSAVLAEKAGVDRKTVDRVRHGEKIRIFSLNLLASALKINLDSGSRSPSSDDTSAPTHLGGYARRSYESYIGHYYMFRNSYDFADRIICSNFEIVWDGKLNCMRYRESQRNRREQDNQMFTYVFEGDVAIPPGISVVQFIGSSQKGFTRIITTTSQRGNEKFFFKGILLGINEVSDIGFHPAATPVYIEKREVPPQSGTDHDPKVGSFPKEGFWHEGAVPALRSVTKTFSAFRAV